MYQTFDLINDFVKEVYGFDFLKEPMDSRIRTMGIKELESAYVTTMSVIHDPTQLFSDEFVRDVYPLVEISFLWGQLLKERRELTAKFLENCKSRAKNPGNFYGTIFEIEIASRCLLANCGIRFIEDCTRKGEKQIDFVFYGKGEHGKLVGVDCLSKRFTGFFRPENLTIETINKDIEEHAKKFDAKYINKLSIPLDEKVLVVDITTEYYHPPEVLADLESTIKGNVLDAVVFTWREDAIEAPNRRSLISKYKRIGSFNNTCFHLTHAMDILMTDRGLEYYRRKDTEHPPIWGATGSEESYEDYRRKKE